MAAPARGVTEHRLGAGVAGVVLATLAACAVNPVAGRREATRVSQQQEREIGGEEADKIAATMGLVKDPGIVAYVRQVGARLADRSPYRDVAYTFNVVDLPDPNAFALPGGYVYVSRGLLALMNSEDELAGVIGHEVAHIAARHAVQRVSRAAPIGGDILGGAGRAANELVLAPYGRDQEREADRLGAELAAQAGWDPSALASALRTLEREERLASRDRGRASFFTTHPPLPERVSNLEAQAKAVGRAVSPSAHSQAAFLARLDGLVVGPSVADGIFDGRTFLHPDLGVVIVFPEGWRTENERDAVGAREPNGEAMIVLEVAAEGDDPAVAVAALDRRAGTDLASLAERTEVGGRRALRVTTQARADEGPLALDLTWIALGGTIFRVTGAAEPAAFERHLPTFHKATASVRPLSGAERARIRETRVRVVTARGGETVGQLAARTGSVWKADMTAVANGLTGTEALAEGRAVKVAMSESYRRAR